MDELPPELVAKIFVHCCDPSLEDDEDVNLFREVYVVTLSHVCHRWRSVALNHPMLWSNINISSEFPISWTQVMLERPAGAEIDVKINLYNQSSEAQELAGLTLSNPSRLRSLDVRSGLTDALDELIGGMITRMKTPAPLLEKITQHYLGIGERLALLKNFLAGEIPQLRRLTLSSSWNLEAWGSPLMASTLTYLDLGGNCFTTVPSPPGDVLDALGRMVNLEFLSLYLTVALPGGVPVVDTYRKVQLRNLNHLIIWSAPMEQVAWLLQHLAMPVSAQLSLYCELEIGREQSRLIHCFTSALRTSWLDDPLRTTSALPSIKYLNVHFDTTRDFLPMYLRGGFAYDDYETSSEDLVLGIYENGTKASLAILLENLPLEDLRHVSIDTDLSPDEIAPLSRLRSLESVHCNSSHWHAFIQYLTTNPITPSMVPFKNLRHIALDSQDFTGAYLDTKDTVTADELVQCLRQ
ncbi:hypothetical protein BKA70DRAFT_339517, partial [Coprinopsis sp. MPI-PUGE-AT-0042]